MPWNGQGRKAICLWKRCGFRIGILGGLGLFFCAQSLAQTPPQTPQVRAQIAALEKDMTRDWNACLTSYLPAQTPYPHRELAVDMYWDPQGAVTTPKYQLGVPNALLARCVWNMLQTQRLAPPLSGAVHSKLVLETHHHFLHRNAADVAQIQQHFKRARSRLFACFSPESATSGNTAQLSVYVDLEATGKIRTILLAPAHTMQGDLQDTARWKCVMQVFESLSFDPLQGGAFQGKISVEIPAKP